MSPSFQTFLHSNNLTDEYVPPSLQQIKSCSYVHSVHAYMSEPDSELLGQKRWEQRENTLLSPVCVPSVCKLHQQHELDQQENEPASGSYVAPHCGIEQRERQGNSFRDITADTCDSLQDVALSCCEIIIKLQKRWQVVQRAAVYLSELGK